ncbi:hypothetical protein [Dyadobacter sp. CY323]|uniref:hypothetical protein n=1 Tax=Dyadobacter sp. CY323 TaxID=2907302 RepID=UPI001F3FAA4F|nr:hypothetical protein [Dyadobacter sp. CY323]MCE6987876.1 hypothetical protein [Dyadobacter sp. CY323]
MNLQFLSNEKGKKTAVIIPIEDWKEIQARLKKETHADSLRQSIKELKLMKSGKLPEPDINELFND